MHRNRGSVMDGRVLQTCVPDYRVEFFELLCQNGVCCKVYSGDSYYDSSIRTASEVGSWHVLVSNRFLFKRCLLWQYLPYGLYIDRYAVIAELNPRSISTWLLVLCRAILRRPMILWGHAWARAGRWSMSREIRLLLWRLCDAKIVYTCQQVGELREILRGPIFPARNALYSETMVKRREIKDRSHFIYVGRLVSEKKPQLLLRGFALLIKENSALHLDFVGGGPERMKLEQLSKEMGIYERVSFHGQIADIKRLEYLYDNAIAAVSPGYVGLSATQAFFFGVPMLIAKDEPHSPEIEACRDEFNTIFFQGDEKSLAQCLRNAWHRRMEWALMSDKIQDDVVMKYSIEKMVESFSESIRCSTVDREIDLCV